MALVGYARVSSAGQSLELQETALAAAGCHPIFSEKQSGSRGSQRPELSHALQYLREGDTLIVTRLDRLARSVVDLHRTVEQIIAKGADIRALEQSGVDTSTSSGKLTLAILGAVAEFETDIRAERQREGIEAAKARGVYAKRKPRGPAIEAAKVLKALEAGEGPASVAKRLGIARSSVYRIRDEALKVDQSAG